jgi:hypothetical protein
MMLEDLMDRIKFRGKPKIVDLTSERRLADKVPPDCIQRPTLHLRVDCKLSALPAACLQILSCQSPEPCF